jgi:hypothetical protein
VTTQPNPKGQTMITTEDTAKLTDDGYARWQRQMRNKGWDATRAFRYTWDNPQMRKPEYR